MTAYVFFAYYFIDTKKQAKQVSGWYGIYPLSCLLFVVLEDQNLFVVILT